jgi:phenylpropionate dioxygenase-like ring-hydroxylating dioxygenase large terminal subunit
MTPKDNERLTRVTGDAPMARLLRENYWLPFSRSEALEAGGAPQRVRLLGHDLVAFRAEDGTVGLMDEYCPHRRASMVLAQVEGCSLRCVYHGWRLDTEGRVVEVPSEGDRSELFASRVKVERRVARDGGGLVWAFLGQGEPPPLPPLPFMSVPPESRWWAKMTVKCNWLQDLEGTQDTVHLNWLHQGFHAAAGQTLVDAAPTYEIEETSYGLRTGAIRRLGDPEKVHLRVAEYIAPFYAFSPSRQPVIPSDNAGFITVPIDDTSHMLFFCFWDEAGPLKDISQFVFAGADRDDLMNERDHNRGNNWGQDREAMKNGHFSGFTKTLLHEDAGVQLSMGPIVDRSEENLCSSDLAVVRMRSYLLDLLARQDAGEKIDGALEGYRDGGFLPFSKVAPKGTDWREGGRRELREGPAIPLYRNCEPLSLEPAEKGDSGALSQLQSASHAPRAPAKS